LNRGKSLCVKKICIVKNAAAASKALKGFLVCKDPKGFKAFPDLKVYPGPTGCKVPKVFKVLLGFVIARTVLIESAIAANRTATFGHNLLKY
jgi:hypothetical protein